MLTPKPTQLSGAKFLASRRYALLADLPRVGKTGSAIMAADQIMAQKILVITTASGRSVWRRGFADWSNFPRKLQIVAGTKLRADTDVCVVSWGAITQNGVRGQLCQRQWDLIIVDEAHAAKNFETKRTQSLYGELCDDGSFINNRHALIDRAPVVWLLTGTPLPNCPLDAYPMMRALCATRLLPDATRGWPDVTALSDFTSRYCEMRPYRIGRGFYARTVQVFVRGRNLEELRDRLAGFFIQRTQKDVGILEPEYEIMPLECGEPIAWPAGSDQRRILEAAASGDTKSLEIHLGPLRRMTGEVKARAIVKAVKEEFDCGLDKIVLAYWHHDVGKILLEGLAEFNPVGIDGATTAKARARAEQSFLTNPKCRVFLGQIQAAGEAIDLSSASNLIFVETSLVPKDMLQMSLRVTNHTQRQQPLVRVAALENSIDDSLQQILMRKWTAIREVLPT